MAPERPSIELILANLGTPTAPTAAAVRAFLAEFLGDPMVVEKPRWLWLPILHGIILRVRPKKVAKAYAEIWGPGGSPLAMGTVALAEAVQAHCDRAALGGALPRVAGTHAGEGINPTGSGAPHAPGKVRVTHCYRYGSPNLAERLAESTRLFPGSDHPIRVVPLFPQRTASSSGTLVDLVARLSRNEDPAGLAPLSGRLDVAELAPTDPGYIAALAEGVRAAWSELGVGVPADPGRPPHLVVSFHGIPEYVNQKEGGRYTTDCAATFEALLQALGQPRERATLAFQSRFGRDPWVGPATDEVLRELPARGVTR
ncbi:MAG: ferrochelatase, partial [Planctomycetota bacterium]|nr:ferrochelatase [Planctomycetota bacterium]